MTMHERFLDILRASPAERRAPYEGTAARIGTRAENIEKDLYVRWILDFLVDRRPNRALPIQFQPLDL